MRVTVWSGIQIGLTKSVQASTTITLPLAQVMLNPNFFACPPMLTLLICACEFQTAVGRPPYVVPQSFVPAR